MSKKVTFTGCIEGVFTPIYRTFVFLLLRGAFIEASFGEVSNRRYKAEAETDFSAREITNSDAHLDFAKLQYDEVEQRRKGVDDKMRALLTISSLSIPALGFSLSQQGSSAHLFAYIGLGGFLATAYLLLEYLGVSGYDVPDIKKDDLAKPNADFKKLLAAQYLNCAEKNNYRTDYRVDVYRAASRWFSIGLLISAGTLLHLISTAESRDRARNEQVLYQLISNPSYRAALTGPAGPPGPQGPTGPQGARGPRGAKASLESPPLNTD